MDEEDLGVMMEWEAPLMQAHAQLLCGEGGREVLNVGFGMVRSGGPSVGAQCGGPVYGRCGVGCGIVRERGERGEERLWHAEAFGFSQGFERGLTGLVLCVLFVCGCYIGHH